MKPNALCGGSLTKAMRLWPREIRCLVASDPPAPIVDAHARQARIRRIDEHRRKSGVDEAFAFVADQRQRDHDQAVEDRLRGSSTNFARACAGDSTLCSTTSQPCRASRETMPRMR